MRKGKEKGKKAVEEVVDLVERLAVDRVGELLRQVRDEHELQLAVAHDEGYREGREQFARELVLVLGLVSTADAAYEAHAGLGDGCERAFRNRGPRKGKWVPQGPCANRPNGCKNKACVGYRFCRSCGGGPRGLKPALPKAGRKKAWPRCTMRRCKRDYFPGSGSRHLCCVHFGKQHPEVLVAQRAQAKATAKRNRAAAKRKAKLAVAMATKKTPPKRGGQKK